MYAKEYLKIVGSRDVATELATGTTKIVNANEKIPLIRLPRGCLTRSTTEVAFVQAEKCLKLE